MVQHILSDHSSIRVSFFCLFPSFIPCFDMRSDRRCSIWAANPPATSKWKIPPSLATLLQRPFLGTQTSLRHTEKQSLTTHERGCALDCEILIVVCWLNSGRLHSSKWCLFEAHVKTFSVKSLFLFQPPLDVTPFYLVVDRRLSKRVVPATQQQDDTLEHLLLLSISRRHARLTEMV